MNFSTLVYSNKSLAPFLPDLSKSVSVYLIYGSTDKVGEEIRPLNSSTPSVELPTRFAVSKCCFSSLGD